MDFRKPIQSIARLHCMAFVELSLLISLILHFILSTFLEKVIITIDYKGISV